MGKIVERDCGLVTTMGVVKNGTILKVNKADLPKPDNMPICPIRKGFDVRCKTACAMFQDGGCALSAAPGSGNVLGRNCPFANTICSEKCAFFSTGCSLITVARLGRKAD